MMEQQMNPVNLITLGLVIVGGLNWGLVGLVDWNLVASLFGDGSLLSRTVYVLVGVSALWQVVPLVAGIRGKEPSALSGHAAR
jgi:uncharacterized protein